MRSQRGRYQVWRQIVEEKAPEGATAAPRAAGQPNEGRSHSTLGHHKRDGKVLTPPIMGVKNLHPASWINNRLAELLWGALIHERLGRQNAPAAFRTVASLVHGVGDDAREANAPLSAITASPKPACDRVVVELAQSERARQALRSGRCWAIFRRWDLLAA